MMCSSRRDFLKFGVAAGIAGTSRLASGRDPVSPAKPVTIGQLNAAAADPVLKLDGLTSPVKIQSMRKVLGPKVTLMADANGSYDPPRAIAVGRMLEDIGASWYEEPCPFDHLEDTKAVADAVKVPLAGGEQESSDRRFRWMIANGAVQVVQPDLHYYGGFVRSARVARMAAAAGLSVSLHLSGGIGYATMLQFASWLPNPAPFQEYKGDIEKTGGWFDPPIRLKNGALTVPAAPGLGMTALPDLLKGARKIL